MPSSARPFRAPAAAMSGSRKGSAARNGFLAGWMSWFGYVVAGALYAIAFGGFALDGWLAAGLPTGGLSRGHARTVFTVAVDRRVHRPQCPRLRGDRRAWARSSPWSRSRSSACSSSSARRPCSHAGDWEPRFFDNFLPNGVGRRPDRHGTHLHRLRGLRDHRPVGRGDHQAGAQRAARHLSLHRHRRRHLRARSASSPSAPSTPPAGHGGLRVSRRRARARRRQRRAPDLSLGHGRRADADQRPGGDHLGAERHRLFGRRGSPSPWGASTICRRSSRAFTRRG